AGVARGGEARQQFLHAVDIAPTLMSLAGEAKAADFDGRSFAASFVERDAPAPRSVQYWEMFGRRAIYADGWKAISSHEKGEDSERDGWRLCDTRADFSESRDLAAEEPARLKEMQALWWKEAERNAVFPLDDRTLV